MACQASLSGAVLQARILELIAQYWLPFPAALAANSPEYLVLPEPLQPKQWTTSTPGPQQGQTQVLQGSLSGRPTCRGRNKTTSKLRGSVAKEEDSKPSHQLYKLQIKATRLSRQTLCLWNI